MYMCVRDIDIVYFYDFCVRIWSYSDDVVFFILLFHVHLFLTPSTHGLYPFKSVADHDVDTSIYSHIIKSQNVRLIDCCLTIVSNISTIFVGVYERKICNKIDRV